MHPNHSETERGRNGVGSDFLDIYLEMLRMEKTFSNELEQLAYPASLSLAGSHINTLIVISLRRPINMSELAREMACSRQQMTNVVEALVEKNLVLRKASLGNRRLVLLDLTESGHMVVDQLYDLILKKLLTDPDRSEDFARAITTVKDSMTRK